jgi:phage shock protein A
MPRPKGSKNKPKAAQNIPLDALIAEESERIKGLEEEANAVESEIAELSGKLKGLKTDLKKAAKKLQVLEEQKAQEAAKAAAAAAKEALQEKIDQLLASGLSLDDILNKLN